MALLIRDDLGEQQRSEVEEWVQRGGRLILADPLSELGPDVVGQTSIAFTEPTIEPACDDPFVTGVERVAVSGALVFDLPDGATGCFPRNDGFFMIRVPAGEGERIVLGGQATLTNSLLGTEDTAVLLVNLLTPDSAAGLHVIEPDGEGLPGESLGDLLPDQVGLALWQIPIAWVALVWWRARRFGRPVAEEQPVRIEASETTVAVGNLLSTAELAPEAAAIIRARVHRDMTRRLGISGQADAETFVAVVADRTDISPQVLRALLVDPLPYDDAGLVRYANLAGHTVARITQRVTPLGPPPAGTPPSDPDDPLDQARPT